MDLSYSDYENYWLSLVNETIKYARQRINAIRAVVTAFNVNIDAVKILKPGDVEELAVKAGFTVRDLHEALGVGLSEAKEPKHVISSLIRAIRNGCGFEISISASNVSSWLAENLKSDEMRIGGQAGISANVLSALGVRKVYVHAASLPRIQAELFRRGVLIPCKQKSEIVAVEPMQAYSDEDEPLIHWVFEFQEGLTVKLNGLEVKAPRSDRFIASYDPLNSSLHVNPVFCEFVRREAKNIDKALISGFQLVKREYPDGSTFKDKILRVKNIIEEWKRINELMWIHVEQAYMSNLDVLKFAVKELTSIANSYGLNEVELECLVKALGLSNKHYLNLWDKLVLIADELGLSCLILHTKNYSMALLKHNVDTNSIRRALWFGSILAAARTITGGDCRINDVIEVLKRHRLFVSSASYDLHMKLTMNLNVDPRKALRGSFEVGGYQLVLVPALYNPRPVRSVGLGDTFTSGFLVCTPST